MISELCSCKKKKQSGLFANKHSVSLLPVAFVEDLVHLVLLTQCYQKMF